MPNDALVTTGAIVQKPWNTGYKRPLPQIEMLFRDLNDLYEKEEVTSNKVRDFFKQGKEDTNCIVHLDRTPYNLQVVADSGKERWEGAKKIEAGKPSITVRLRKSGQDGLFSPNEIETLNRCQMAVVDYYSAKLSKVEQFLISDSRGARQEATITFSLDEFDVYNGGVKPFGVNSTEDDLYKIKLIPLMDLRKFFTY